jgi:6-phosphogluconolactonase (cycloisomerase 2 family)
MMERDERRKRDTERGFDRRTVLKTAAAGSAAVAFGMTARSKGQAFAQEATPVTTEASGQFAYVGSDSRAAIAAGADPAEVGISVFAVDPQSGSLTPVQTIASDNPFFFAFDPTQQFLYAVNVIGDYDGGSTGSVEAYAVDPATGKLTFINRQSSGGAVAAHLSVDPSGKYLVVANYSGANIVVLPINPDGSLEPVVSMVERTGTGPNKERQDMSRPHAVIYDPAGKFIAAADLGTDNVITYALDTNTGTLTQISEVSTAPGAGPRHIAFSLDSSMLYVVNEMGATITSFAYDPATGVIGDEIQTISTVPDPFVGTKSTAEIFIHPSGKFLYNSNRGQPDSTTPEGDAIVGFTIDPDSGELTLIGYTMEGVDVPGSFAIDLTGTSLYSANYDGDSITQFTIDQATGELSETGEPTSVPSPFVILLSTPA